MQLEGSSKRKRRSSDSDGNIENSPLCDAKRLREDDARSEESVEDTDNLATDERLPLTELPVGQPLDDSDESDTDWLEACNEELLDEEDEEEDESACVEGPKGKDERLVENYAPMSPEVDLQESETRADAAERFLYHSRRHFTSKIELMNFFKRKGRTGSEDRTDAIFDGSPALQPKMRSVLLEWIVEVCDVYKLHRETYHLAVDYLDRYLCLSENISKGQLQLIGVTALLIAAKYEEIYPPKISDFAYITDGACTDQDIIKMEGLMVQVRRLAGLFECLPIIMGHPDPSTLPEKEEVLEWRCTVITSNSWVLGFLQLLCFQAKTDCDNADVSVPLYNRLIYETIMHLLDLCSLDCGFVRYSYKVLALSSIYRVIPNPDAIILKVSGYTFDDLTDCMDWMLPFWTVLSQKFHYEPVTGKILRSSEFNTRLNDFSHMRIKHNIDLEILEAVQVILETKEKADEIPELLLTPPSSSEKCKGRSNTPCQIDTAQNRVIV